MYIEDEENLENLFKRYLHETPEFLDPGVVTTEAWQWARQQVSSRKQVGSQRWIEQIEALKFWRHYKTRRTYALGTFRIKRKAYEFSFHLCNYMKSPRGFIYAATGRDQERLFFFTGHFFDRLTQRHGEIEATQVERERAIQEGIRFFSSGGSLLDRDPLLLDPRDGTAYHVMDGGYAVGHFLKYDWPTDSPVFQANQTGELTVCLFKTFLSHSEISDERMDHMLHLYQVNKIVEDSFDHLDPG